MLNKTKVFIDPRSRVLFASYYIAGLYTVYGKRNVRFATSQFKDLDKDNEPFSFEHYFAFVVKTGNNIHKVIIDYCDPPDISEPAYHWCDTYAKINFNPEETETRFLDKLVNIPPAFGIRIWNLPQTAWYSLLNFMKCILTGFNFPKKYFKDYYHQYLRMPLSYYRPTPNKHNNATKPYVFMIATLWNDVACIDETNLKRKTFVTACKALDLNFEGGFYVSGNHLQLKEFEEITFTKPYTLADYITKTKASTIVFNTPAVHLCHGWKLAEYLAMGKAIITTPLYNQLPQPLMHKQLAYHITSETKLTEAITELTTNTALRTTLEQNAIAYYESYVKPEAVIMNLIQIL